MMYVGKDNLFHTTEDDNDKIYFDLIQELQLIKGENPLRTNRGVDYLAVLNKEVFLQLEIEEVLQRHRNNFSNVELGDLVYNDERVEAPLTILFKDGTIKSETLSIIQ